MKIIVFLAHVKLYINRRPKLRKIALAVLTLFPSSGKYLKQATAIQIPVSKIQPSIAPELADLSRRARRIYADLKVAIEERNKENS
ncbi:MAG: hypothetical protein ABFD66_14570 [Smithella sp.]